MADKRGDGSEGSGSSNPKRGDQPDQQADPSEPRTPSALVAVVYEELRKLASARMAREYGPQTLQTTALVHEAWLRLGADKQPKWQNRAQFFAAASEAMRRILVDRARRRRSLRHGGEYKRVDLDAMNWEGIDTGTAESNDDRIIALHEALEELTQEDPKTAELVKLRYFTGLDIAEAAELVEISERTARHRLTYARARLSRTMGRGEE